MEKEKHTERDIIENGREKKAFGLIQKRQERNKIG